MADTVKTTTSLSIELGFVDGDTRTITIPNPKPTLTAEEVKAVATLIQGVLLGDKNGADFSDILGARIVNTYKTEYDIG